MGVTVWLRMGDIGLIGGQGHMGFTGIVHGFF